MSKYQVEAPSMKKVELENHITSFMQDKHYSYSRISQGEKDNLNSMQEKDDDILDLLNQSEQNKVLQDSAKESYNQSQHIIVQGDNLTSSNIILPKDEGSLAIINDALGESHGQQNSPSDKQEQHAISDQNNDNDMLEQQQQSGVSFENGKNNVQAMNYDQEENGEQDKENININEPQQNERFQQRELEKVMDSWKGESMASEQFSHLMESKLSNNMQIITDGQLQGENIHLNQEVERRDTKQEFGDVSEIQKKEKGREAMENSGQEDEEELQNMLQKQEVTNESKGKGKDEEKRKTNLKGSDIKDKKSKENLKGKEDVRRSSLHGVKQQKNKETEEHPSQSRVIEGVKTLEQEERERAEKEEKKRVIEEKKRRKQQLEVELRALDREISEVQGENGSAVLAARRFNRERQEREERHTQQREEQSKQFEEEVQQRAKEEEKEKERAREEKQQKIRKKIEEIRMRSEERRNTNKQSNEVIREIKEIHKKVDPTEKYRQEVELPELERRKKELAEKRKLLRPIELEEIKEHAKKHDDEMRMRKLQSKSHVLVDFNANIEVLNKLPKGPSLQKVLEEDKLMKMRDILEQQKKKQLIERRTEYAKLVKEVHQPKVLKIFAHEETENRSPNTQDQASHPTRSLPPKQSKTPNQLPSAPRINKRFISNTNLNANANQQFFREHSHNRPIRQESSENIESLNNFNPQFIENCDSNINSFEQHSVKKGDSQSSKGSMRVGKARGMMAKKNVTDSAFNRGEDSGNPGRNMESVRSAKPPKAVKLPELIVDEVPQVKKQIQTNYISDLRKQRENQEKKQGKKAKLEDWEKYKYDPNLSQKEKYLSIMQSAARLEHNAKLKNLYRSTDPNVQEEVNELYIDSIKAKLSLLDNLN